MGQVQITGYYPGAIGEVVRLHGSYYAEHWNLTTEFECQVARELSDFIINFENNRDGFWVARVDGQFGGAIAIDGSESATKGARLRWFIVASKVQKTGLGRMLINRALAFCRNQGHSTVFLWTFKGLEEAKNMYVQNGFHLIEESNVQQWGRSLEEQKYLLQKKR